MGSLHNVDHLVNTILNKLTLEEKQAKVFNELKIDDNEQLDGSTKEKLKSLISEFLDVFSENKFDLGSADLLEAEINLDNGDRPIVEPYLVDNNHKRFCWSSVTVILTYSIS